MYVRYSRFAHYLKHQKTAPNWERFFVHRKAVSTKQKAPEGAFCFTRTIVLFNTSRTRLKERQFRNHFHQVLVVACLAQR